MDSINFEPMSTSQDTVLTLGFELSFESSYAEVYIHNEQSTILCVLRSDYVPIAEFRALFGEISKHVIQGGYSKFIFDKRSLRTFHQPSMEWYFIDWKLKMLDFGLTEHRKILPDLDWFKKAVEIARDPLLKRFPKEALDKITINYCDSIEEALVR